MGAVGDGEQMDDGNEGRWAVGGWEGWCGMEKEVRKWRWGGEWMGMVAGIGWDGAEVVNRG